MKNTFPLCLLIFVCFLVIGYSTSTTMFFTKINNAGTTISTAADKNVEPIRSMENGQRNILLVHIDSINSQTPSVQGVWLLTYLPTDNHLNFLPVFPSGKSQVSEAENRLHQSFGLLRENGKLLLDQKFIDELKAENYWWSGYLIFDHSTQEKMLGFFRGKYENDHAHPLDQATQTLPGVLEDTQGTFIDQLSMIKTACQYLSTSQNTDWSKFFFLMSNQISSDLDPQQLISDWNSSATSKREPTCQFPTLQQHVNANYMILLTSVMK